MSWIVFITGNEDLTEGKGGERVYEAHVVPERGEWPDYMPDARHSSTQGTPGSVYVISSHDLLYGTGRAECVWNKGKYVNREDDPDYADYLRLKKRYESQPTHPGER